MNAHEWIANRPAPFANGTVSAEVVAGVAGLAAGVRINVVNREKGEFDTVVIGLDDAAELLCWLARVTVSVEPNELLGSFHGQPR